VKPVRYFKRQMANFVDDSLYVEVDNCLLRLVRYTQFLSAQVARRPRLSPKRLPEIPEEMALVGLGAR